MNPRLVDLLDRLNDATTSDAAWSATTGFFEAAGFEVAAHGYGHVRDVTCADLIGFRTNWPELWQRQYEENHYYRVDPIVQYCVRRLAPCVDHWDWHDLDRVDPAWRTVYREAGSFPWKGNFVAPLRFRQDAAFGAFVAATPQKPRELMKIYAACGETLYLAALLADAKLVKLVRDEDAAAVGLTSRERECLLWLSQGLRNDRIAERMHIANPTVEMHLANARRKLGAATREQALAKAAMLGLVAV